MVSLLTVFSTVIIRLFLFNYLTSHNTPADNRPPSNRGRGRSGGMSLNNSMYGDGRLGVCACTSRTSLPPTKSIRSRKNRGGGYIKDGNENNNSTINSPDPKKKGMFYFIVVYIVCMLFIVCILYSYIVLPPIKQHAADSLNLMKMVLNYPLVMVMCLLHKGIMYVRLGEGEVRESTEKKRRRRALVVMH